MTHNPNYWCQRCMGQDFEVVYQRASDENVYKCLDCGWEPTLVIDIPGSGGPWTALGRWFNRVITRGSRKRGAH